MTYAFSSFAKWAPADCAAVAGTDTILLSKISICLSLLKAEDRQQLAQTPFFSFVRRTRT